MSSTTLDITSEELTAMVKSIVDERIIELIGDPEDKYELKDDIKARLLIQRKEVERGDRGVLLDEVIKSLELG